MNMEEKQDQTAKLLNARDELEKVFAGQFMQPIILLDAWYAWSNDSQETVISTEPPTEDDSQHEDFSCEYWPAKWGYRLSAAGYMDCTDWALVDSELEAIESLLSMYGPDA